jgi:hypothetical protein
MYARLSRWLVFAVLPALSLVGCWWLARETDRRRSYREWRQANANAAHSRFLPQTVSPPLRLIWAVRSYIGQDIVAEGNQLYLNVQSEPSPRVISMGIREGKEAWTFISPTKSDWGRSSVAIPAAAVVFTGGAVRGIQSSEGMELFAGDQVRGWISPLVQLADGSIADTRVPYNVSSGEPAELVVLDARSGAPRFKQPLEFSPWSNRVGRDGRIYYLFRPLHLGEFPALPGWLFLQAPDTLLTLELKTLHPQGIRHYAVGDVGQVAAGGDRVYCLHREGAGLGKAGLVGLTALNRQMQVVWKRRLPQAHGPIIRFSRLVVTPRRVLAWDGVTLWAVERTNGTVAWQTQVPRIGQPAAADVVAPVATGNIVHVGTATSGRYGNDSLVSLDEGTGRILGTTRLNYRLVQALIAHDGALYACASLGQHLFVVKLAPVW